METTYFQLFASFTTYLLLISLKTTTFLLLLSSNVGKVLEFWTLAFTMNCETSTRDSPDAALVSGEGDGLPLRPRQLGHVGQPAQPHHRGHVQGE